MKVAILATGSRGDVQPFVAMGFGLQQAGHEVYLATNSHFETWIRSYGLNFHPSRTSQASGAKNPGRRRYRTGS
jgi:UDP:flavonoid glycosyltransferase YjiC (YdhE family)